jgi:nitrite reductase/ring-hydroxylating ferredoxin subunit/uncharacterized membrane protein
MLNWQRVVERVSEQPWVDPAATSVQEAVQGLYDAAGPAGQRMANFLHGTWLGHPLHPVLTDIPIGAWMVAMAFDTLEAASGREDLGAGADTAVALGLGASLATAAAGLTDWHRLRGRGRRVGLVHAALNVATTTLYAASLALRKSRLRGPGRLFAFAGFATLMAGAYVGADLVYANRIGVDHTLDAPEPEAYQAVLPEADLAEGELRRVQADSGSVLIVRRNGRIYALADTCAHLACSLADGQLEDESVRCGCHGSRYALEDGRVLDGPSTYWQPTYSVRLREGQIEVGKRDG